MKVAFYIRALFTENINAPKLGMKKSNIKFDHSESLTLFKQYTGMCPINYRRQLHEIQIENFIKFHIEYY